MTRDNTAPADDLRQAAGQVLRPLTSKSQLTRLVHAYLQTSHAPHRTLPTRHTRAKLKLLLRLLGEMLQTDPRVYDLNRNRFEALKRFLEWHPMSRATVKVLQCLFLSLMRFAQVRGILGDVIQKPSARGAAKRREIVETGDGTLWDICEKSYFRLNLTIRSEKTQHQYRMAIRDLSEFLKHPARPEDLCDDAVSGMMRMLLDRELAPKTVNERRGRINALWTWLAKRKLVEVFPTNYRVACPHRLPEAWNEEEVRKIFESCAQAQGQVAGIPAADWWTALHCVLWNSGERIGAILAVEWDAIDWANSTLFVKAEIRKAQSGDMLYRLSDYTLTALTAIRRGRGLIFPWEKTESTLYNHYKRILRRAGLKSGQRDLFHKVRRSVVSHLEAAGINATPIVGHASREVTIRNYIDRKIARTASPAEVLFQPTPAADVIQGTLCIEGPRKKTG